jgi:hypothetical protein
MKKSSILHGIGGLRKGEMCKMTQEMGSQKNKMTDANVDRVVVLVRSDRSLRVRLIE